MNLAARFRDRFFDRLIETPLDQEIRTFSVDPDAGKIRMVSNAPQPRMQFRQIEIRAKEAGNDDDSRAIPAWHAPSVVDRSGVQQKNLSSEKSLCP